MRRRYVVWKGIWIFVILFLGISLLLVGKLSNPSVEWKKQRNHKRFVREERVQVRHVNVLNNFINGEVKRILNGFNQSLSDKIGAYRSLPDTRDEACRARNYYLPQQRLKVSIIIAFHNEARSTLMRTIMSVYRRTPSKYLHEFILLDDHSDDDLLLSTLRHLDVPPFQNNFYSFANASVTATVSNLIDKDDIVTVVPETPHVSNIKDANDFPVIKMQRNSRRLGLIESRNVGARLATGDYLLFLDSHCEVNVGWLEPLLDRIMVDVHERTSRNAAGATTVAVSPVLDSINAQTLKYRGSSQRLMGGFDWNLHFHWMRRERSNGLEDATMTEPFKSPVFSGGVFMIARQKFLELGGFNPLLQIWGGESIEFSIKLWLCGGQIEIVPCSRVGHIFRREHPFRFPNGADGQSTYLRNSKIIAESWLDSYKHFFYALKPAAHNVLVNISHGELQNFKRNFHCKTFAWYLSHVFPQLRLPNEDFIAYGKLSTAERCLHILKPHDVDTIRNDQKFSITSSSHIRLQMTSCYHIDVTHWYFHRHSAQLQSSNGACLNVVFSNRTNAVSRSNMIGQFHVVLQYCHERTHGQRWIRRGVQLIHEQTHFCLDNPLNDVVAVSHCRRSAPTQLFRFSMEMQQL